MLDGQTGRSFKGGTYVFKEAVGTHRESLLAGEMLQVEDREGLEIFELVPQGGAVSSAMNDGGSS